MKKNKKKAQNGESLIPEWFNSPYKGDLKSFSPKVDVKKKEGQSKKIEQQKKVEKILSKQKTIGPTKQFISHDLEKKHEEDRLKKLEEYAATHPEVEVSPYGNLTTSSYGEFIQKYGKNLDKFASSWETPMVIQGAGDLLYGVGKLGAKYLPQLGEYLTTQTPLKNTYKINPFVNKLGQYNRVVGEDAILDLQQSGLIRSGVGAPTTINGINVSRPTMYPSFAKGTPRQTYINQVQEAGQTPFIISTNRPMGVSTLGRHGKGTTQFPIDESGKYLTSFPASETKVYEATPHWLKGYKEVPKPKSTFKSEIDWSKWNPETPSYPELINEYNAIEESTKKAGTWMKNPDGTPFEGLPEQFIQQQSSHFKKAFPEGINETYRGVNFHNPEFENKGIFTANKNLATNYTSSVGKENILTPYSKIDDAGVYRLAQKKSNNAIELHFAKDKWDKLSLKSRQEMILDEQSKFKDYIKELKSVRKEDQDLYNLIKLHAKIKTKLSRQKLHDLRNVKENDVDLINKLKGEIGEVTTTDRLAQYIEKNNINSAKLNNIIDGGLGDVLINNNKPGNYLKSLVGNVGFFDMSNPNIYKGIIPPVAVGAAISQESSGKEKLNYGGVIKTDNMEKARKRKAQMGYTDKTGKKFIVPKQQEMLEDDIPTIQLSDEEIAATSGKKHVNNLVKNWDESGYLAERNGFRPNNLSEILATGLMAVNYMLPEEKTKWPVVRPQLSYNPYPQGTGSQAIAKNGITISETGYKRNSKDKNKSKLRIPSNMITMEDVDFPVLGTSDNGITKIMYPGENHVFPGANFVDEERIVAQKGAAVRQPIYTSDPNDPRLRAYRDSLDLYNNYKVEKGEKFIKNIVKSWDKNGNLVPVNIDYYDIIGERTNKKMIPIGFAENNDRSWGHPVLKKPVQPIIYQPEPKIDAPKKRQTSYARDLSSIVPIEAAKPNLSQALYDSSKPTNWSFTYPTGQYNEQKTMYFPDRDSWKKFVDQQRNVTSQQGNNSGSATGYMEYGGVIPDISKNRKKFKHGGKIQPLTDNVIQFNGPSHADGGIDIEFGNKQVEVEGGETGYLSPIDNSFNVMGNMINPITGKKFKQDSKILAKKEQKVDKLLDYSLDLVENSNPRDKWDLLKFNSGAAQLQGAYKKKQQIQESKEHLSNIQKAMLDFANENGGDPIEFSKGGIIFPKKKQILGKAQSGINLGKTENLNERFLKAFEKLMLEAPDFVKNEGFNIFSGYRDSKKQKELFEKSDRSGKWVAAPGKSEHEYGIAGDLQDKSGKRIGKNKTEALKWLHENAEKYGLQFRMKHEPWHISLKPDEGASNWVGEFRPENYDSDPNNNILVKRGKNQFKINKNAKSQLEELTDIEEAMETPNFKIKNKPKDFGDYEYNPQKVGKSNYDLKLTNLDKIQNDSYLRDLSFEQIAPELLVAATNKPEPVFMQEYTPDLYQPYNVSFQDQLNENTATFKPLMKYNAKNPSVQATLAAQKYGADQSVLANEFRTNQGIEADIVNKNIALLNDAELKNLQLADTQYVRQDKARSNTRIQNIGILQSISDKLVQNEAEKRNFQVIKNLFPYYSFDKNYDANFNGPSAGEMLTPIDAGGNSQQNATVIKSNDNKGYKKETTVVKPTVNQQMDQLNLDRRRFKDVQMLVDILRGPKNRFGE